MLSIIIPTKDYDCHLLIEELHRQGETAGIPFEIILGEDGTAEENLAFNSIADTLTNCRRIITNENIGRARMRNLLASESRHPNLIFIDSDAVIENKEFLANYATALKTDSVVCGGLYHADKQPDGECSLRYRYEKAADKLRDAATRSKAPYDRFTTFNFAIRKEIFISILFDNSITRYGYEDVLFGKELKKRGIPIAHIDNKLLHSGLENNATFLAKTEQAIASLARIKERLGNTPLLSAADKLHRYHLKGAFMSLWKLCRKTLVKNLMSSKPSLWIFKIYKLGYYLSLQKEQENRFSI